VEVALIPSLQEAEQAAYADTRGAAGQAVSNAPAQDVQPITGATSVMGAGAMDVDEGAVAQGTTGEGHGGVKRKAGEDAELASKKLRMGMSITRFHALAADTMVACRISRCSFEEVNSIDIPPTPQLLTIDFRDRENCTAFVSDLPESATEGDLKALFKDVRSLSHFVCLS
jgi:hypothetical protein